MGTEVSSGGIHPASCGESARNSEEKGIQDPQLMRTALNDRLDWLCDLPVGTVWTEYHWREACQIKQEMGNELDATIDAAQEVKP